MDQAIAIIDAQAALGVGVGGVAFIAVVREQRTNLLLEEFHSGGRIRRGRALRRAPCDTTIPHAAATAMTSHLRRMMNASI